MLMHWLIVLLAVTRALTRPNELVHRDDPLINSDSSKGEGKIEGEAAAAAATTTTTETQFSALLTEEPSPIDEIEKIATVARASSSDLSISPDIVKSAEDVIQTIGEMVEKDTRTPPKLKEIIKESKNSSTNESKPIVDKVESKNKLELASDSSEGKAKKGEIIKGVAVPVIMDEDLDAPSKKLQKIPNPPSSKQKEEKKKTTTVKPIKDTLTTTTPSSGLSTWILLSDNKDTTTQPTKSNKKSPSAITKKQKVTTTTTTTSTVKPIVSKSNSKNKSSVKTDQKKTDSVLETMVKNQKKNSVKSKNKESAESKTESSIILTTTPYTIDVTEKAESDSNTSTDDLETTTKKKTTSKKRKKNKKKKPAQNKTDAEIKDVAAKQPVGAQFYNFLSREIMPTVGIGLVGVLVTAGLAGLLGYNPFVTNSLPIRRTYENRHGYSPNHYYSYTPDPSEDGGQAEEVLFREVLSGMPENSRYDLTNTDGRYGEDSYYRKTDSKEEKPTYSSFVYDNAKDSYSGYSDYVYSENPTSEKYHASVKIAPEGKIEKQPEAIYQVSGVNEDNHSWHSIGSPLEQSHAQALEPGPRRLNLDEMTKVITNDHHVAKRSADNNDLENEIDGTFDKNSEISDTTVETMTTDVTQTTGFVNITRSTEPTMTTIVAPTEDANITTESPPSLMEVLKKVGNFKLRLGLSVLKTTADAFSRYLGGVLKKVEDNMINETNARKNLFFEQLKEDSDRETKIREKRYRRDVNYFKKPKHEKKKFNKNYKSKQFLLKHS